MDDWITAISTTILTIATVFLAIAAWEAKKSFLRESLYNDSWELYKKWNDLKTWLFSNRTQLDNELLTKEKIFSDTFKEKLDSAFFLYVRVKHYFGNKLDKMGILLSDLESVWLIYDTKQHSKDIDKYKFQILKKISEDEISLQLYNNIINKMK